MKLNFLTYFAAGLSSIILVFIVQFLDRVESKPLQSLQTSPTYEEIETQGNKNKELLNQHLSIEGFVNLLNQDFSTRPHPHFLLEKRVKRKRSLKKSQPKTKKKSTETTTEEKETTKSPTRKHITRIIRKTMIIKRAVPRKKAATPSTTASTTKKKVENRSNIQPLNFRDLALVPLSKVNKSSNLEPLVYYYISNCNNCNLVLSNRSSVNGD